MSTLVFEIITIGLIGAVILFVMFSLFKHPQGLTVIFTLAIAGIIFLFQSMKRRQQIQ